MSLYDAVNEVNAKKVKSLIANGADVNSCGGDMQDHSCLRLALFKDVDYFHPTVRPESLEIIEMLIEAKADVNLQGSPIWLPNTALHHICRFSDQYSDISLAKKIIDAGANMRAIDCRGQTALSIAVSRSYISQDGIDLVTLLLDHGSDVTQKDATGQTPLQSIIKVTKDNPFPLSIQRYSLFKLLIDSGDPAIDFSLLTKSEKLLLKPIVQGDIDTNREMHSVLKQDTKWPDSLLSLLSDFVIAPIVRKTWTSRRKRRGGGSHRVVKKSKT